MLTEQTFDAAGLTISYDEGPPSGPPMVLLHGLTLRRNGYRDLIAHFTPDWHVYSCDLRGHGRSGRVADRYRVVDYIPDIVAFLRDHVTEPATIVGHSLGGLIALGVAKEAPELVRALVLLDPAVYLHNSRLADDPLGQEFFGWVYDTVKSPRTNAEMLERCLAMTSGSSEAAQQGFADMMFGIDPDAVRTVLEDRLFEMYDLEGMMRQVLAPTLLLYAGRREDSAVRDEDVELAQKTLPHGVVVIVPDAGHMIHMDQIDFVVEQMKAFLHSV